MNLDEQRIVATNQIHLSDSLDAPLLKIKIKREANGITPDINDLIIYVDKNDSSMPTAERKQFVFELLKPLQYLEQVSDEFLIEVKPKNDDIEIESYVERKIETTEMGNYVLTVPEREVFEGHLINLFEGENYIYTNYSNVSIEVIYPKDDEFNRRYLNSAIYFNHRLKNNGEFCLDDIYFKDAFTKTEDKLNFEVDNAKIKCLTSKDNKFSLDEEGNLVVNSITTNNNNSSGGSLDNQSICNLIYPIGSIYMSINNLNPTNLFGGTWEQLKDRFLLGAGDVYSINSAGGEATHTLTDFEMPNHTHEWTQKTCTNPGNHTHVVGADKDGGAGTNRYTVHISGGSTANSPEYAPSSGASGGHIHNITGINASVGSSAAHNNMPPYLTVYIWKRIA